MREQEETLDLPPSYGTRNCYDCGQEPVDGFPFWERFVILHGQEVSVPQCDTCLNAMMAKSDRKAQ